MSQLDGTLAELRAAIRATEKGMTPSRPLVEHCRYDLLIDDGEKIHRVQVKQSRRKPSKTTGSIGLDFRSANRPDNTKKKPFYTADEIDAILVYLPDTERFYWLPPEVWHGKSSINLRLEPSKNNQTKNIWFADDFVW